MTSKRGLISSTDLVRDETKDSYSITKHVVYYCNCFSIDHHARITIFRDLDKRGFITFDDITWEFNATHLTGPSICYNIPGCLSEWLTTSIKRLKSRVVAAKNILMGKPVDFYSDICLDTSEMKELMAEVEKAIKEVDDEQDKIAKELLAKKAESEAKSTNV